MKKSIIVLILSIICSTAFSASLEKAKLLSDHGLVKEAKLELIDVVFSKQSDKNKSAAYYELGNISFGNNQISPALKTWTVLVKKYPNSKEAKLVKSKLEQLSEIVGESSKENIDNAVAASYLRHANFWSSERDSKFIIDSSWIPKVETAVKWYDKVITEFPNSVASRIAYEEKIRTLIGWKERGKYGSSFGTKENFEKYMPQVLSTFSEFEKSFPKAPTLQAFRYQIAQTYWGVKDWDKTRLWLNTVVEKAGKSGGFYKDTAERRLQKVEY